MRTKIYMAILVACLSAASEAAAQFCELETIQYRSEGDGMSADFSSVDTSTCALGVETTVHVEGTQGVTTLTHTCGGGANQVTTVTTESSNVVTVHVGVYDRCSATQLLLITATGEADDLQLSQNFKTASLRAAFEGSDDFGQPVSIAVDLVWNGVGDKERIRNHVNDGQGGAVRFRYTSSGTIRDAVAVGSVAVDGTAYTPLPSNDGTIEKDASREYTEYR